MLSSPSIPPPPRVIIGKIGFGGKVIGETTFVATSSNAQSSPTKWCKPFEKQLFDLPLHAKPLLEDLIGECARRIQYSYSPTSHIITIMTSNKLNIAPPRCKKELLMNKCIPIDPRLGLSDLQYKDTEISIVVFASGFVPSQQVSATTTAGASFDKQKIIKNTIDSLYYQAVNLLDTGKTLNDSIFPLKTMLHHYVFSSSKKQKKLQIRGLLDIAQAHFIRIADGLPHIGASDLLDRINQYLECLPHTTILQHDLQFKTAEEQQEDLINIDNNELKEEIILGGGKSTSSLQEMSNKYYYHHCSTKSSSPRRLSTMPVVASSPVNIFTDEDEDDRGKLHYHYGYNSFINSGGGKTAKATTTITGGGGDKKKNPLAYHAPTLNSPSSHAPSVKKRRSNCNNDEYGNEYHCFMHQQKEENYFGSYEDAMEESSSDDVVKEIVAATKKNPKPRKREKRSGGRSQTGNDV